MSPNPQPVTQLHTPSIKVEQITPQMASQYLGTSAGNRNLKRRAVVRYARDMVLGRWVLNGESIKFDRAGHLIDGHHRLHAILDSKVTITMVVVRGIQEGSMLTLDTGVGRSFMDAQQVRGNHVTNILGPTLRWWFIYDVAHMQMSIVPTHQELQEILDAHPSTVESARTISRLKLVKSRCAPGVQAFVHAYASHKFDREMADEFMSELNDGAELGKTSPIYLLRSRLIEIPARTRLAPELILALTIKAWNAWITKGTLLHQLKWNSDGEKAEPFPVFKGDEDRFARARMIKKEDLKQKQANAARQTVAIRKERGEVFFGGHTGATTSGSRKKP